MIHTPQTRLTLINFPHASKCNFYNFKRLSPICPNCLRLVSRVTRRFFKNGPTDLKWGARHTDTKKNLKDFPPTQNVNFWYLEIIFPKFDKSMLKRRKIQFWFWIIMNKSTHFRFRPEVDQIIFFFLVIFLNKLLELEKRPLIFWKSFMSNWIIYWMKKLSKIL